MSASSTPPATPRRSQGPPRPPSARPRAPRLTPAERAEVRSRNPKYDVGVVNVSRHGAMIEAPIEPRIGEKMQIRFEGLNRTDCTVRWIRGGRMGLEFSQETGGSAPAAGTGLG